MEFGRRPGKGIRGWSVSQESGIPRARATGSALLDGLGARRQLFIRIGIAGLMLWATGILFLGDRGVVRLRSLRAQAVAMGDENRSLEDSLRQTQFELKEEAGLNMERVMRERYGKALPNEVVYHKKIVVTGDSSAVAPAGRTGEMER